MSLTHSPWIVFLKWKANHVSPTACKLKAELPGLASDVYHVFYYLQILVLLFFFLISFSPNKNIRKQNQNLDVLHFCVLDMMFPLFEMPSVPLSPQPSPENFPHTFLGHSLYTSHPISGIKFQFKNWSATKQYNFISPRFLKFGFPVYELGNTNKFMMLSFCPWVVVKFWGSLHST